MAGESDFAGTKLLRPLLNESRDSLHRWAIAHQLSWIEDESNQDDAYDRNFLRLRIVPLLSARWPHFAEAVARSASRVGYRTVDGHERSASGRAAAPLAGWIQCANAFARGAGAYLA